MPKTGLKSRHKTNIMKEAIFNPSGEKLWITVKMQGLYYMTYVYYMWGTGNDSPAILTNPKRYNNNKILIDDFYQIINDFKPGEKLSKYHERVIQVALDVNKLQDDFGYIITVNVWQTSEDKIKQIMKGFYDDDYTPPVTPIAEDKREGKIKTGSVKVEKFYIILKDSKK